MEGAKTFRRKRAILFLEQLEAKEATLKKQLETPELQTANPIIVGELKATQAIINEFVQQFKLFEFEEYAHLRNDDTDNEREFKEQLGMAEESSFDIIKAFVALNNECFLFSRKENLQLFFL